MLAHNKSAIAYQDRSRCRRRLLIHKRKPHQQPGLLPSCTNGAPGAGEAYQKLVLHSQTRCRVQLAVAVTVEVATCEMQLRKLCHYLEDLHYVRLQAHVQFMLDVLNTSCALRLSCS
jgi:hypothetical protein